MDNISIRLAKLEDVNSIVNIYDYYVKNTAISFEYETPSVSEYKQRMKDVFIKYPFYVATINNEVVGFTYAHEFIKRKAYDHTAEGTIYVSINHMKKGIGKLLYNKLEESLIKMGIVLLYACVGKPNIEDEYLNNNSYSFHQHLGFKEIGFFKNSGYKFSRWYNMVYLEKQIQEFSDDLKIIDFKDISEV